MLLVITYSRAARQLLRNICRAHEDTVVRRLGRAALFEPTHFGAFLALRLRERHGAAVQVERTRPFNEFEEVPADVRTAASAYAQRSELRTPYRAFAAGTSHPDPTTLKNREL